MGDFCEIASSGSVEVTLLEESFNQLPLFCTVDEGATNLAVVAD
jgi:hypothetical protein